MSNCTPQRSSEEAGMQEAPAWEWLPCAGVDHAVRSGSCGFIYDKTFYNNFPSLVIRGLSS